MFKKYLAVMTFCLLFSLLGRASVLVATGGSPSLAYYVDTSSDGEKCRESLYSALSRFPLVQKWPPTAQFKIDIIEGEGVKDKRPLLRISIRAIADAYYDPDSGDEERLKAALMLLSQKEWSVMPNVVCNPSYDEGSFGIGIVSSVAGMLDRFLSSHGTTKFLDKFTDRFDVYFSDEDMVLEGKLMGKSLSYEVMLGEIYTDSSFSELEIYVDSYALVYDPEKRERLAMREKVLNGVLDGKRRFRLATSIKVVGRTEDEVNKDIDAAAKKAAGWVINYLRGVSMQVEI